MEEYLPFLYFVIGVFARAVLPWLAKIRAESLKENGEKIRWQWSYLRGQLLASLIVIVALPLLFSDFLDAVYTWDFFEAWAMGYTTADLGRVAEKLTYKD